MPKRIGGLWKSTNEESKAVLSGTIDLAGIDIGIAVFPNDDENKKDESPQYHILSFGVKEKRKKIQDSESLPF